MNSWFDFVFVFASDDLLLDLDKMDYVILLCTTNVGRRCNALVHASNSTMSTTMTRFNSICRCETRTQCDIVAVKHI